MPTIERKTSSSSKMSAWRYENENDYWRIEGGDYSVAAYVEIKTRKETHTSWSNKSGKRTVSVSAATVSLMTGYAMNSYIAVIELDDLYKGEIETLLYIMKAIETGDIWREAEYQLESRARQLGVSEIRIMDTRYNPKDDRKSVVRNLGMLIIEAQTQILKELSS